MARFRQASLHPLSPVYYWVRFLGAPFSVSRIGLTANDVGGLTQFYRWNLIMTALVVALKDVLTVSAPNRAVASALIGVGLVLFGGSLFLPVWAYLIGLGAGWLRRSARFERIQAGLMAVSPWALMAAVVNALSWSPFVIVLLAFASLFSSIHGTAHALHCDYREATFLVTATGFILASLLTAALSFFNVPF